MYVCCTQLIRFSHSQSCTIFNIFSRTKNTNEVKILYTQYFTIPQLWNAIVIYEIFHYRLKTRILASWLDLFSKKRRYIILIILERGTSIRQSYDMEPHLYTHLHIYIHTIYSYIRICIYIMQYLHNAVYIPAFVAYLYILRAACN